MPDAKHSIRDVHAVGRYALGVTWGDEHQSIYPFASLRKGCPCLVCEQARDAGDSAPDVLKLASVQPVADASVVLAWSDGRECLLLVEELRGLCGCAACKGEPDYPVTGQ